MEQEKWTISFVSDAGVSYKVSIYEEGFTGTAIVLSPASSPFTITEKNGNDIYEPIHTQSGYISVICDTQTFESLIPTDYKHHRVILRSGTNIIWTGWMSPESYNVPTRNTVQEYKFPVVCGISVLDCQDMDMPVAYSRMSIAKIIATCLPTEYQNVYIQDNVDDMLELQLTASVFNFMEKNDSISIENGEPYYIPRMTLKTILECVCRFFGWSLHTQGNSVFLTSPDVDDDHLVKFYAQDLYWEDLGRAERVRYNSAALTSIIPADTSAKTEIIRGYKTIIIDSSVNESTEVLSFDIGKAKMSAIRTTDVYIEGEAYKDAVWNIQMEPLADEGIPGMEVYGANIEDYYLRMYEWDVQDPEFVHDYAEFYKEDIFKTADAPRKHNYDWNTVFKLVCVDLIGVGSTRYAMRFTTNREYTFSNGMLCIAADVWSGEYNTNRTTVGNTGLYMSIKVGDKYWNGSSWQSTEIFLLIETGDDTKTDTSSSDYDKGRGKIITSKHYTENYEEAEGYGIRIGAHDVITGRVEITLGRAIDVRFQKYELSNFRVFFASAVNTTKHVESNNTYKRKISEKFTDEYSVKNEFSSWNNNKIGEALLAEPDSGFVSTLPYDKGNIRPEIYLLDRMQAHFSRFTKRLTVPAIGIPEETPLTKYSYGGAIYYAIGREMDYIKDKVTLTLDSL